MSTTEPCGCDEVQRLRAENARLNAIIDLVLSGSRFDAYRGPQAPDLVPAKPARCANLSDWRQGGYYCELPLNHAGEHRRGQVVW